MKKTLAIYFSDPEPMGYPLNKPYYLERYEKIISDLEIHGINVIIVRGNDYIKNGYFKQGWKLVNGKLKEATGERYENGEAIHADLIFNRDDKNTIPVIYDCNIINHPEFDQLCLDKAKTFETLPEISPKTVLINSYKEYLEKTKKWDMKPEDLIVLKKNFESEGRGTFVRPVSSITKSLFHEWSDVIAQEFLDSSVGIPGITNGLHDLRIRVVNGKPINAFLRTPKKGSYVANLTQGGKGVPISLEDVPTETMNLVHKIDKKIKKYFPIVYAADFINSDKGFKLLELNSRPGLEDASSSSKFNNTIVNMLVGEINKP